MRAENGDGACGIAPRSWNAEQSGASRKRDMVDFLFAFAGERGAWMSVTSEERRQQEVSRKRHQSLPQSSLNIHDETAKPPGASARPEEAGMRQLERTPEPGKNAFLSSFSPILTLLVGNCKPRELCFWLRPCETTRRPKHLVPTR